MEHQFFKDRLSAYFDNELKNEEHVIVHEHVIGCEECKEQLQQLEKLESFFAEKSELSESDYWEQSALKIESALDLKPETKIIEIKKSSSKSLWWKLTGVAASLAIVALFTLEEKKSSKELLLQETPSISIKNEFDEKAPIVGDTVFGEAISESVEEAEDDNEIVPFEITKPTENLRADKVAEKLLSKKQITSKPKPAIIEKEQSKSKPTLAEKSEISNEKIVDDLRSIEFKNGGVQAGATESPKTSGKIEKSLKQSISAISKTDTDEAEKDIAVFENFEELIDSVKFDSSPRVLATSLIPDSEKNAIYGFTAPQKTNSNNIEINYWRRKVDENSALLNSQTKKTIRYMKSATADTTKKQSVPTLYDKDALYKQLFESYYHIALMTTDSTEEAQAVQFLKTHADSLSNSYSGSALQYLQLYRNERNKQKTNKD